MRDDEETGHGSGGWQPALSARGLQRWRDGEGVAWNACATTGFDNGQPLAQTNKERQRRALACCVHHAMLPKAQARLDAEHRVSAAATTRRKAAAQ
jgi:hypothetical protein